MRKPGKPIPLFDLDYGMEEEEAVLRVLRSKWLTMGEETKLFEKEFAEYIDVKHAIAVSSCSAALHLANLAVGIEQGDEVICPSLTFVATANSILQTGGRPVFVDVKSENDWTISPEAIEKNISPMAKAILVVHYAGFSCDMDAINKIAQKHGLKVIEDAAHALGSDYKEKKLGSLGDVSCFSFFSNKNLSTGEGGIICTDSDEIADKLNLYRSHGMTSLTLERHKGHSFGYDVVEKGFNYRIDEIRSALGRAQLKKLDGNNRRRRAVAELYKKLLSSLENIRIPFLEYKYQPNYHIFPILLNRKVDRAEFMQFLRKEGVQTSIHYNPVHTFTYYRKKQHMGDLRITEEIGEREVSLPMYPALTEGLIHVIAHNIGIFLK